MLELFSMGGPLFMGILSIVLLVVIVLSVKYYLDQNKTESKLNMIKSVGLFGLVVGIFGQLIGLFDAFKFIEQAGSIAPGMLAGGIKVSMITTLYGLFIYIISYLIWFGLKVKS